MENQVRIRLREGWLSDANPPQKTNNGETLTYIPIFLILGGELPPQSTAFVPANELCIFVNSDRIRDIAPAFGFTLKMPYDVPEFDLPNLWAIILLHESGHIYYSDQNLKDRSMTGSERSLNIAKEVAKTIELRADQFAAMQIRITLTPAARGDWYASFAPEQEHSAAAKYLGNPVHEWKIGTWSVFASEMALMITEISDQGWENMMDQSGRISEEELRRISWDRGFSHPNLGLRFVYMSSILTPSEWIRQKQLYDFLRARNQEALDFLYRPEFTGLLDGKPRPSKSK